MNIKLFAVYDSKAAAYGRIIECPTEGLAARTFSDACLDPQGPLYKHADDYALHEIGSYDPTSGRVESLREMKFILAASSVKQAVIAGQPELPAVVRSRDVPETISAALKNGEKAKA